MVVAGLIPQTARFPDGARARGCETVRLVASPPPAAARVVALVLADPLLHRSATTPCSEREQLRLPSGFGRGVRAPGHGSVPISPDHRGTSRFYLIT